MSGDAWPAALGGGGGLECPRSCWVPKMPSDAGMTVHSPADSCRARIGANSSHRDVLLLTLGLSEFLFIGGGCLFVG